MVAQLRAVEGRRGAVGGGGDTHPPSMSAFVRYWEKRSNQEPGPICDPSWYVPNSETHSGAVNERFWVRMKPHWSPRNVASSSYDAYGWSHLYNG